MPGCNAAGQTQLRPMTPPAASWTAFGIHFVWKMRTNFPCSLACCDVLGMLFLVGRYLCGRPRPLPALGGEKLTSRQGWLAPHHLHPGEHHPCHGKTAGQGRRVDLNGPCLEPVKTRGKTKVPLQCNAQSATRFQGPWAGQAAPQAAPAVPLAAHASWA